MSYCTIDDCKDTLIKVEQNDVDEATAYVDALATSKGVNKIKDPTPYEVKQLAIAYALGRRALYLGGKQRNGMDGDPYLQKKKFYDAEVQRWEAKITAELLSGASSTRKPFPRVMRMVRG